MNNDQEARDNLTAFPNANYVEAARNLVDSNPRWQPTRDMFCDMLEVTEQYLTALSRSREARELAIEDCASHIEKAWPTGAAAIRALLSETKG